LYEDLSLPLRALRDLMRSAVEKVRVDSRECFERTTDFAHQFMPDLAERIEHYPGERPIFDLYGVEDEIQRALKKEVPLKSGGYLVIDQTEAMTTIDVNTGAFLGHRNLEETVYKTNLEAAQAAARQLRLRNLGGIIIIDFIDMTDEEHKRQVLRMLEKQLAQDHAKTTVYEMSPLGLVEMTRKRTVESLERQLCEPCPTCEGRGSVKTAETVTYEIFREITRAVRQFEAEKLLVLAAPKVVARILDEESAAVAELEEFIGKTIRFQAEDHYAQEQYDVVLL
jgi:ribonuclease G